MCTRERRGNMVLKLKERSPKTSRNKTPSINELRKKLKGSPKGKRKLNFHNKGPLVGKTFYLDLMGYRNLAQLKKVIKKLNGVIEEFFHKDVMYLVTNRDTGKSPSSQSVCSPATPSPFNVSQSSSVKSTAVPSPMSTDSPQSVDNRQNKPSHNTRGQAIFKNVSAVQKKGTTDVLTNANTWGVNVYHVDQVVNWFSKLMAKTNTSVENSGKDCSSSRTNRAIQGKVPKVVPLRDTFLKVEDLSFKYRPLLHEFKKWPEITFNGSIICPFDEVVRRRSSENKTSKQKNKVDPKSFRRIVGERAKHGYCECCEDRYKDLDIHLKGEQHQKFAKTSSNYTSLDKAINSAPTLKDFLNEIRCKENKVCDNNIVKNEPRSPPSDDAVNDDVFLLSSPTHSKDVTCPEIALDKENCNSCESLVTKGEKRKSDERKAMSLRSRKQPGQALQEISPTRKNKLNKNEIDIVINVEDCQKIKEVSNSKHLQSSKVSHQTNDGNAVPFEKSGSFSPVQRNDASIKIEGRSSSRRKRKATDLQLSPILPCDSAAGKSMSTSVDDSFLPSGLPVYSSLGSSLGDVFKDASTIISRIENQPNTDLIDERKTTELSSPDKSITAGRTSDSTLTDKSVSPRSTSNHKVSSADTPVTRHRSSNPKLSSPVKSVRPQRTSNSRLISPEKSVIPHHKNTPDLCIVSVDLEREDIQFVRRSVKSVTENDSSLVKRKRSPNDEVTRQQARKCKRLTKEPDFGDDEIWSDSFSANIAERVKLQRALYESLQESLNTSTKEKELQDSSPRVTSTCYKGTSPFTELTNKDPSRRERVKSEGRIKHSNAFSKNTLNQKKGSKVSRSACLTPNDPFNFSDL